MHAGPSLVPSCLFHSSGPPCFRRPTRHPRVTSPRRGQLIPLLLSRGVPAPEAAAEPDWGWRGGLPAAGPRASAGTEMLSGQLLIQEPSKEKQDGDQRLKRSMHREQRREGAFEPPKACPFLCTVRANLTLTYVPTPLSPPHPRAEDATGHPSTADPGCGAPRLCTDDGVRPRH